MLEFLHGRVSERKLRLFACACCRRMWHLLIDERSRRAIENTEQWLDKPVGLKEENRATKEASEAVRAVFQATKSPARDPGGTTLGAASVVAEMVYEDDLLDVSWRAADVLAGSGAQSHADRKSARPEQLACQTCLLRDIVGNPFRPVLLEPFWLAWNDDTLRKMAQVIYDDRAFDRLPILADALEDAGCDSQDILDHCRSGGEHVRGCWVADLLLGKS